MKKIWITLFLLALLFLPSCSAKNIGDATSQPSLGEAWVDIPAASRVQDDPGNFSSDADLDQLLDGFILPAPDSDGFQEETEGQGFPLELVNQLKKAVCDGTSDTLISQWNDKSLMITADDFIFQPNNSEDAGVNEKRLNEAMQGGAFDYLIYQCDIDGDQVDEIIMAQNLKYEYSHSNIVYLLKRSGDSYVFSSYDYLGYYRCLSIFQYDGKYYLAANFDDYDTRTSKAVGLFELTMDPSSFMWLIHNKKIYVCKTNNGYKYNLLYENEKASNIEKVKEYVDEISIDLIYTERNHGEFYGDEKERYDLLTGARDVNPEMNFWGISETDVNNDGKPEFFDRKIMHRGLMNETEVTWYDPMTQSLYASPYEAWSPSQYFLTQLWFKVIDGKTIIFSLFHKDSEDIYLLDARMVESGRTVQILDYVINLKASAEISDYWDYKDTNWQQVDYQDPDLKKAFPDDLFEKSDKLAKIVQGNFVVKSYQDEEIPEELILLMEKALFDGKPQEPDLSSPSYEISVDEFNQALGTERSGEYDGYIEHIYHYVLDQRDYYLTVADTGGSGRFVEITIYREEDGEIPVLDYFLSLDLDARVIEYDKELYLIEASYNYYSKYTDTVMIMRLVPEGVKDYVMITLEPERFESEKIYGGSTSYEEAVEEYVMGIKDDLMDHSPINDDIKVYQGDETRDFDQNRLLRLRSVGGDYDYYAIDFNNDGETEYCTKHFWFPSNYTRLYLINNLYRFTDKRILEMSNHFYEGGGGMPVQLWFKEIDGKIFTFRLFLGNKNQYYLNVSLVEGAEITQVLTYIIVPYQGFHVESGTRVSQ